MSILIATSLKGKAVQAPDYTVRDIDGKTIGRLEEHQIIGIPEQQQPAYSAYVANIDAFITSTALQTRVVCGSTYKPSLAIDKLIPIPMPPVALCSPTPLKTEEDETRYLASLAPGSFSTITHNLRKLFVVEKPVLSMLATYPQTVPRVATPAGTVNGLALQHFATAVKIVTLFLTTHSYAAFQTEDETGIRFVSSLDVHLGNPKNPSSRGRFVANNYHHDEQRQAVGGVVLSGPESISAYPTKTSYNMDGTVLVAKPAPLYTDVNASTMSNIPTLPGYDFPYFPGQFTTTGDEVIDVFRQYFVNLFGLSKQSTNDEFRSWCNSVQYWVKTEPGKQLSHIISLIRTALECQGRLYATFAGGKYIGCAIQGYKLAISHNGMLVPVRTAAQVKAGLRKMDAHEGAVAKILELLKEMTLVGESDLEIDPDLSFNTPRELLALIQARDAPNDETEMDQLIEAVNNLAFDQTFWMPTHDNIVRMMSMLCLDSKPDNLDTLPCHFDSTTMFDRSIRTSVMSAFGPMAPSFVDQGGAWIKIPEGIRAEDPQSIAVAGASSIPMPKIFVTMKKLKVASQDMTGVLKTRKIRQQPLSRDAGFRTIAFSGPSRDAIWEALKAIPWEKRIGAKPSKRKSAPTDEDGSGSSKRLDKGKDKEGTAVMDMTAFSF